MVADRADRHAAEVLDAVRAPQEAAPGGPVGLLDTLAHGTRLDPVPVDERVAAAWALLRQRLKAGSTKMEVNDSWIAATAMARGWPVVTRDDGFPTGIPGLTVIRV